MSLQTLSAIHPAAASASSTMGERKDRAEAQIKADSPEFKAATRAMAWGGFSAFSVMYGLQPLMPMLSEDFHISATVASGVISAAAAGLAIFLIPASIVARRYGLKRVMCVALGASALLTLLAAFATGFTQLLLFRGLLGIALAGFPAVGMAYLSEEIEPQALGRAMGLYIAGNALGGLLGRLIMAFLAEWVSWRMALGSLGTVGLLVTFGFWRNLPDSRHSESYQFDVKAWWGDVRMHWSDAGLPWLFLQGFLLMGCYVSFYNYLGYRLVAPPFEFRHSWLGLISLMNIVGMFASAWAGRLADCYGRRKVMWWMVTVMLAGLVSTVTNILSILALGTAIFTFGFFGAHAIASSWVGRRANKAKALAASFYLCAYYMGSSWLGSLSGVMWGRNGWMGVVLFLSSLLLVCVAGAVRLRSLAPKE